MPKPRATLSPIEEAIISKGGEPGASAVAEPINEPVKVHRAKILSDDDEDDNGKEPTYRHTMVRFKPKLFGEIKDAIKSQSEELSVKISLNAWVISACIEKLKRDTK
jgi:hypothetical protein